MSERILAGASVRIDPDLFCRHFRLLRDAAKVVDAEVDFFYILDGEREALDDAIASLLKAEGAEYARAADRPPEARYSAAGTSHDWSVETFDHLARSKQRILDKARSEHYDRVLLCDTDLLIEPTTIRSMLAIDEPIVSAVFWTEWERGDPGSLGPNVWLRHPYGQSGKWKEQPEFWERLAERRVTSIAGGGACILLDTSVLDRVRYHPRLDGLPSGGMWQGEDRTMAVLAERHHIPQYADPWPDLFHCYHPDQREPEYLDEVEQWLSAPRKEKVRYGDLVSLTLESLDIEALAGRSFAVRGRIGGLGLLPEIEAAVLDMSPGDERLLEIFFPETWPEERIRGKRSTVRLRLVDCKEFGFSPVLADRMLQGVDEN